MCSFPHVFPLLSGIKNQTRLDVLFFSLFKRDSPKNIPEEKSSFLSNSPAFFPEEFTLRMHKGTTAFNNLLTFFSAQTILSAYACSCCHEYTEERKLDSEFDV